MGPRPGGVIRGDLSEVLVLVVQARAASEEQLGVVKGKVYLSSWVTWIF